MCTSTEPEREKKREKKKINALQHAIIQRNSACFKKLCTKRKSKKRKIKCLCIESEHTTRATEKIFQGTAASE